MKKFTEEQCLQQVRVYACVYQNLAKKLEMMSFGQISIYSTTPFKSTPAVALQKIL
jgi:hypothetical protein